MSQYLRVHPTHPQGRLVNRAAEIVRDGGVIVYPTDSTYAIGCHLGDKEAVDRIRAIRRLPADHHFTLMCRDLSELATYARVDNTSYRVIRRYLPALSHSYCRPPVKCPDAWSTSAAGRSAYASPATPSPKPFSGP